MRRSSGLQLVGIVLLWIGVRFFFSAPEGMQAIGDTTSTVLFLTALAVGIAALFAAIAVFRGSSLAPRLTSLWAGLTFLDVVFQQWLVGSRALWDPTVVMVLMGSSLLLVSVVLHVRHHTLRLREGVEAHG